MIDALKVGNRAPLQHFEIACVGIMLREDANGWLCQWHEGLPHSAEEAIEI